MNLKHCKAYGIFTEILHAVGKLVLFISKTRVTMNDLKFVCLFFF